MTRVGESSGGLDEQLHVLSTVLQQDFDASIERLIGLMEPMMIIMVGAVVGIIGITVISTVYSIIPSIGE